MHRRADASCGLTSVDNGRCASLKSDETARSDFGRIDGIDDRALILSPHKEKGLDRIPRSSTAYRFRAAVKPCVR